MGTQHARWARIKAGAQNNPFSVCLRDASNTLQGFLGIALQGLLGIVDAHSTRVMPAFGRQQRSFGGLRVWGLGARRWLRAEWLESGTGIRGSGFTVWVSRLRVQGGGFRVEELGWRVQGSKFGVHGGGPGRGCERGRRS